MIKQKALGSLEKKTKTKEKQRNMGKTENKKQKIKGSSIHRFNTQNKHNSAFNFDSKNTSELSRFTIEKGYV